MLTLACIGRKRLDLASKKRLLSMSCGPCWKKTLQKRKQVSPPLFPGPNNFPCLIWGDCRLHLTPDVTVFQIKVYRLGFPIPSPTFQGLEPRSFKLEHGMLNHATMAEQWKSDMFFCNLDGGTWGWELVICSCLLLNDLQ